MGGRPLSTRVDRVQQMHRETRQCARKGRCKRRGARRKKLAGGGVGAVVATGIAAAAAGRRKRTARSARRCFSVAPGGGTSEPTCSGSMLSSVSICSMRGGEGERAPCGQVRRGDVCACWAGLSPSDARERAAAGLPAAFSFPAGAGLLGLPTAERKRVETGRRGEEATAAAGAAARWRARFVASACLAVEGAAAAPRVVDLRAAFGTASSVVLRVADAATSFPALSWPLSSPWCHGQRRQRPCAWCRAGWRRCGHCRCAAPAAE
eukprot:6212380-Pleurochrysis_carterae.AAC.2